LFNKVDVVSGIFGVKFGDKVAAILGDVGDLDKNEKEKVQTWSVWHPFHHIVYGY
jgi:hypothetical protein